MSSRRREIPLIWKHRKNVGTGRYCKLADFGETEEFVTLWQEGTGFVYDVTPLGPLCGAFSSWWLEAKTEQPTELTVEFSYDIRFGLFGQIMHRLERRKNWKSLFHKRSKHSKQGLRRANYLGH